MNGPVPRFQAESVLLKTWLNALDVGALEIESYHEQHHGSQLVLKKRQYPGDVRMLYGRSDNRFLGFTPKRVIYCVDPDHCHAMKLLFGDYPKPKFRFLLESHLGLQLVSTRTITHNSTQYDHMDYKADFNGTPRTIVLTQNVMQHGPIQLTLYRQEKETESTTPP